MHVLAMFVYGLFWTNSHKNEWQVISLTLALQFWVMVVCDPWSRSTPSPSPNMNDLKTMVIYVCRTMNGHVIKLNVQSAFMHNAFVCSLSSRHCICTQFWSEQSLYFTVTWFYYLTFTYRLSRLKSHHCYELRTVIWILLVKACK